MSTEQQRLAMARSILGFEAAWDKQGHLAIAHLRADDGGGAFEVAGINVRYNPVEAEKLADLIEAGQYEQAEQEACDYIAQHTDTVGRWTSSAAVEAYLRDCCFNRGTGGAAWMARGALGLTVSTAAVDASLLTAMTAQESQPQTVLKALRAARERYEREVVKRNETSVFWRGLVNRWNKALAFAESLLGTGAAAAPVAAAAALAAPVANVVLAATPAAPENFYVGTIMKDPRFRSPARISDPLLLENKTRAAVDAIIKDAENYGRTLKIFETYRSKERQAVLFAKGASKLKNVGVHHYGLACDLVIDVNGEPTWPKGAFQFLGDLARQHGLVWGGDWGSPGRTTGFVDDDHVQRCTIARQSALFAGTWYPDDAYDPYKDGAH